MKRTDLQKKERELKRARKKMEKLEREGGSEKSIGDYIKDLHSLFFHDEEKIYNTMGTDDMLELFEEMQISLSAEDVDTVLRKAIRKTKVKQKDAAFTELKKLLE